MHAELIAVGAELTSGHTINTNATYLARRLQKLGIICRRHVAVGDDPAEIVDALNEAMRRASLVIVTGGLGPTFDDLTMEAIAQATGRRLVQVPAVAARIRQFYRRHHRRLNRLALRQALLPEGGHALPNPDGTAPGLWLSLDETVLVALPGVPREMRAIMEQSVLPRLRRRAGAAQAILSRTIRTVGLVELQIQEMLRRMTIPSSVQIGLYPHLMMVDVRFTATDSSAPRAASSLNRLERELRRRVGEAVYGLDEQTLEEAVGAVLQRRHFTLAVAESCTGGLVSDQLTNVPGSSAYFLLSVVAYHNRAKQKLLGVSQQLLSRHGAVSAPVARAMAQGVRAKAGADLGLAITGIAGPSGGTKQKPVGLVYVALADRRRTAVKRFLFPGDRLAIKQRTCQMALDWLRRFTLSQHSP